MFLEYSFCLPSSYWAYLDWAHRHLARPPCRALRVTGKQGPGPLARWLANGFAHAGGNRPFLPITRHHVAEGEALLAFEAAPDHFQRQEGVPLLAQYPTQPLDVLLIELSVTRRGALGVDEPLAL
jgi:hypothetical protein